MHISILSGQSLRGLRATERKLAFSTVSSTRERKKVLVVNHGLPPAFNGGSEIYSQVLAVALQAHGGLDVAMLGREQDPFRPDLVMRKASASNLATFYINIPREEPYHRYIYEPMDELFSRALSEFKPDVVHLNHLNHLSLSFPKLAKDFGAKVVYTLHDYWLLCPRGQFIQVGVSQGEPQKLCSGANPSKCASTCFSSRYGTGVSSAADRDTLYWTQWNITREEEVKKAAGHVDAFIAPSLYLLNKFTDSDLVDAARVMLLPYGFDHSRLGERKRLVPTPSSLENPYVFAYIGRHEPSKGVQLLVEAAAKVRELANSVDAGHSPLHFKIVVFGRSNPKLTPHLQRMVDGLGVGDLVEFQAEYANKDILLKVFNHVDTIVCPSLWYVM